MVRKWLILYFFFDLLVVTMKNTIRYYRYNFK
jgi:hypothetical protein